MKKIILTLFILVLLHLQVAAQNITNNSIELGFQFYGLPISDIRAPMGGIVKLGYDIVSFKKQLIVSIQPYVGGGLFAYKNMKDTDYNFKYKYTIGVWEIGITPKLHYPIIEDELYLYLANDISFINMYAKIWDNDKVQSRQSSSYMSFYNTCKVGLVVKKWKRNMGFWIGYTTIDFAHIINKNRTQGLSAYGNEKPGICFGASVYL